MVLGVLRLPFAASDLRWLERSRVLPLVHDKARAAHANAHANAHADAHANARATSAVTQRHGGVPTTAVSAEQWSATPREARRTLHSLLHCIVRGCVEAAEAARRPTADAPSWALSALVGELLEPAIEPELRRRLLQLLVLLLPADASTPPPPELARQAVPALRTLSARLGAASAPAALLDAHHDARHGAQNGAGVLVSAGSADDDSLTLALRLLGRLVTSRDGAVAAELTSHLLGRIGTTLWSARDGEAGDARDGAAAEVGRAAPTEDVTPPDRACEGAVSVALEIAISDDASRGAAAAQAASARSARRGAWGAAPRLLEPSAVLGLLVLLPEPGAEGPAEHSAERILGAGTAPSRVASREVHGVRLQLPAALAKVASGRVVARALGASHVERDQVLEWQHDLPWPSLAFH